MRDRPLKRAGPVAAAPAPDPVRRTLLPYYYADRSIARTDRGFRSRHVLPACLPDILPGTATGFFKKSHFDVSKGSFRDSRGCCPAACVWTCPEVTGAQGAEPQGPLRETTAEVGGIPCGGLRTRDQRTPCVGVGCCFGVDTLRWFNVALLWNIILSDQGHRDWGRFPVEPSCPALTTQYAASDNALLILLISKQTYHSDLLFGLKSCLCYSLPIKTVHYMQCI